MFCWYFKHLNAFLAQCEYFVGKWEILGIVDEGVNNETRILLQFWDFHGLNVDDAWNLLLWVAWDYFEFDKACCIYGYSFPDPCAFYAKSYYALLWCDLCNSSSHNVSSCPIYACYTPFESSLPLTQCTGLEVGESFGLGASLGVNDACCEIEPPFEEVHHFVETPFEQSYDMCMHAGSPSLDYNDIVPHSPNFHVSTFSSPPSSSPPELAFDRPNNNFELNASHVDVGNEEHMFNLLGGNSENFESLGSLSGYDAALDPYCTYLVDLPRKSCGVLSLLSLLIFLWL